MPSGLEKLVDKVLADVAGSLMQWRELARRVVDLFPTHADNSHAFNIVSRHAHSRSSALNGIT